MPRPICIKCKVEFRCKKNGYHAVLLSGTPPEPYQIWDADMWECPSCHAQILSGFGSKPIAENWQTLFPDWLKTSDPKVQVFEKPAESSHA